MTRRNRLEKLAQQSHSCPTCQRPYDARSSADIDELLIGQLRERGYSDEEARQLYRDAVQANEELYRKSTQGRSA